MRNKKGVNIRYLRDEKNRGSVMKVVNDFLVDIMGAIIPGFLFIFSLGIALGVPIILIYDISIPKSFYNSIFSFGAIILILLLSYVIGHAFYRADINKPDKESIAKKMKIHINEVYKECKEEVKGSEKKPDGPTETIPDDISYRMKHMLLDRKYLDSSQDKSLAHYVSMFYSELISAKSNTPNNSNRDNVFYIIKNHFDGIDGLNNPTGHGDESDVFAKRSDFFNLIDILSDCIEYVVNCYLSQIEHIITQILPDNKEQWSIVIYMKVFFKEIKYIDYCDNYGEYKYLLNLIQQLKNISLSDVNNETKKKKSKDQIIKEINNKLKGFSDELDRYKVNILEASGVKSSFFKDYNTVINSEVYKNESTVQEKDVNEQDNNSDITKDVINRIRNLQKDLFLYASIRRMQNEEGTPHEDAGGFPYINYENYLFKRNLHHLAEMVNWNYREGRTKNQINRYKIKIQLFCPEAYGVLNKNESHVRMASSSWFASKFLIKTNYYLSFAFLIIVLVTNLIPTIREIHKFSEFPFVSIVPMVLAILCPLFVVLLLTQFKNKIEDFIHYQRLREIYFALYTYHECKNEIEYKEEYYSHCPFPDNDMFLNEDENEQEQ